MASQRLINSLNRAYTINIFNNGSSLPGHVNDNNNLMFNKYLSLEIKANSDIEYPVFLKLPIHSAFEFNSGIEYRIDRLKANGLFNEEVHKFKFIDNYVVPLYISNRPVETKKTGDSIMNYLYNIPLTDRLVKFMVNGQIYYCATGLILDSNFEVLFMSTFIETIDEKYRLQKVRNALNISPKTFTNNDLVSKTIVTKMLPIYISNNVNRVKTEFFIKDMNYLIKTPVKPKNLDINTEINSLLINNVEELLFPMQLRQQL